MVPHCTCAQVAPCENGAKSNIMQCADQCQKHVADLGASYPAMRSCLLAKEPMLQSVINCEKSQLKGACAASPGGQVPKRYPETLKMAAYTEINSILSRSGIQAEAKAFLAAGKKLASCVMKCMQRGTGQCFKRLGCGLALPPDNVIVQSTKRCAIQAGFNTPGVQQLCNCVASAGVRNLAALCNRIQIS
ncbi:unnamed protein product [Auanema sp. JU1783]|nr:unnamed protein product [Auanema sp. JU1783]